jgi:hypothetical protein
MRDQIIKTHSFCVASTFIVAMLLAATHARGFADPKCNDGPLSQLDQLLSDNSQAREQAVDKILNDRKALIKKLIPLIDPKNSEKFSDETRCVAAYLLGELRAVEAVPVLSQALADPPGEKFISDGSRYDAPVFSALVRIGRPAVAAMIENIKTTDDLTLQNRSLDVLLHVLGGKQRLLELLVKLNDRALAEKPVNREEARRFREAHVWAEAHYVQRKGYEEPLY